MQARREQSAPRREGQSRGNQFFSDHGHKLRDLQARVRPCDPESGDRCIPRAQDHPDRAQLVLALVFRLRARLVLEAGRAVPRAGQVSATFRVA